MGVGERVTRISLKKLLHEFFSLSLFLSSFTIESFPPLLSSVRPDNSYLTVERLPIPKTIKEEGERGGGSKKAVST